MAEIKSVAVYLGSSNKVPQHFKDATAELGNALGDNNLALIYGGMADGPMGIIARTVLDKGGHVTGVLPKKIEDSNRILHNLSETIHVKDLWERKLDIFDRSDALVAMPGGYGTLDEVTEVLHWLNEGLHNKPVVLVNVEGYWDDLIECLERATDAGYFPEDMWENIIVTASPRLVVPALKAWTPPQRNIKTNAPFPHFEHDILAPSKAGKPVLLSGGTPADFYKFANALVFKQLDKHHRPVTMLDPLGIFEPFEKWVETARKNSFITDKCSRYPLIAQTPQDLKAMIDGHVHETVDLDNEKWGERLEDQRANDNRPEAAGRKNGDRKPSP